MQRPTKRRRRQIIFSGTAGSHPGAERFLSKKAGASPTFLSGSIIARTSAANGVNAIRLRSLQINRSRFAWTAIGLGLESHLLAFVETAQAGTLNGADMHENVWAAVIRLNETEAFLIVEKLYCADSHDDSFQSVTEFLLGALRGTTSGLVHDFEEGISSMARLAR
jgi:hypothetical protein